MDSRPSYETIGLFKQMVTREGDEKLCLRSWVGHLGRFHKENLKLASVDVTRSGRGRPSQIEEVAQGKLQ